MLLCWQDCRNENPVAAVASLIPQLHPSFCCSSSPSLWFFLPIYFSKKWLNNHSFGVRLSIPDFFSSILVVFSLLSFRSLHPVGLLFFLLPLPCSVHVGRVPVPTVACLPLCFLRFLVMSEGFSSVEDPHLCQALAFRQRELEVLCIF